MFTRNECSNKKWIVADVSEDGSLCVVAFNDHLRVYNTLQNIQVYSFKHDFASIKLLKISPSKTAVSWLETNPNQVFISVIGSGTPKVVSSPHCEFTDEYILWSPIGNILAVFSRLSMFINIYKVGNEETGLIATVSGAKFNKYGRPLAQFSYDGQLFSAANVSTQGHSITVYTTNNDTWNCLQRIFINNCDEVCGLLWCRDSASVLVWHGQRELRLQMLTLYARQEHVLADKCAPATCVCVSLCGRLAAILTADSKVRIVDVLTWQLGTMGVMVLQPVLHKSSSRSALREPPNSRGHITVCEPISSTVYELKQTSSAFRREPLMQFSARAQYLAIVEPRYPNTLWVWNLTSDPPLDTVIALSDNTGINGILWHNHTASLAASLPNNRVLFWTPQQSIIVSHDTQLWPFTAEVYFATVTQTS